MTDFKKLKVVELRAELASRNLPQTGKRDELIERLEEYEFHHAEPSEDEPMEAVESSSEALQTIPNPTIPTISPVLPPSPVATTAESPNTEEIEEEKRRQRAIRFGLDPNPPVRIEVTIKRLEHALPNYRRRHHHKSRHGQVKINKP